MKNTLRLIVVASEDTCETIRRLVATNNLVIDVFEDSGFWYTNGETGSEWFTVQIDVATENKLKFDVFFNELLEKEHIKISNKYWS